MRGREKVIGPPSAGAQARLNRPVDKSTRPEKRVRRRTPASPLPAAARVVAPRDGHAPAARVASAYAQDHGLAPASAEVDDPGQAAVAAAVELQPAAGERRPGVTQAARQ